MTLRGLVWRGLVALAALALLYQAWIFLHIWWWVDHNPGSSALMDARLGELREQRPQAELKHRWVSYTRISPKLKRAVIAAEDAKFRRHDGFDWEGMQHALDRNLKHGRIVAGGSTISQQLAKNLFLSTQRTPWRKLQEAVITVMLEKMMSKRRILEIYLNIIEWGNGVFGVEAAARHYFGTSAGGLSGWQAARLAAMIPNPRYYDQHRSGRALKKRTAIIAARMHQVSAP